MTLDSTAYWNEAWDKYSQLYVNVIPRQAYYLSFLLRDHLRHVVPCESETLKFLELGAGSYRDTAKLNDWGYDCIGLDYSEKAHSIARENYPLHQDKLRCGDALNLDWPDRYFDVSFHNGLFVCFRDDDILEKMMREQARVTKTAVVCTVHNHDNTTLKNNFRRLAKNETLYDIRFFTPAEMHALMDPFCSRIDVVPFGNGLFDLLLSGMRQRHLASWLFRASYKMWNRSKCERLMWVGHLK